MDSKVSKVAFSTLPPEIQKRIQAIFVHRAHNRKGAKTLAVLAVGAMGGAFTYDSHSAKLSAAGFGAGVVLLGGLSKLGFDHKAIYQKEELDLFAALRRSKEKNVQFLLTSNPFIIVNRNGDLVGKKRNLKIGFVPIGRRRIPSPQNKKGAAKFRSWARKNR